MTALPDVNVLLALAWEGHSHHPVAQDWFSSGIDEGWATCLLTQSAFVRLSMNPRVVQESVTAAEAIELLRRMTDHNAHQFFEVMPAMTHDGFNELVPRMIGYRQTTDATLLHIARTHGLQFVTFDRKIETWNPWFDHLLVLDTQ